jgi:hypothetical protein
MAERRPPIGGHDISSFVVLSPGDRHVPLRQSRVIAGTAGDHHQGEIMTNTANRIFAGIAAALLLSGVGVLFLAEPASAAVRTPSVAASAAVPDPTKVPAHVPVNVCGNTIDVHAGLNPAFGNTCVND